MKIQRRLTLNFFIQFIVFLVTMFIFCIFLFILIIKFVSNLETETRSKEAIITNLTSFIFIIDDEVTLDNNWHKVLKDNDMWMQVINKEGKVIYTINTPETLNDYYTINELLEITDSGILEDYKVRTYYDSWTNEPYYYLFGYKDPFQETIEALFMEYNENGIVPAHQLSSIEKEIQTYGGFLQIYKDGELIQSIGQNNEQQLNLIELIGRIFEPGKFETSISYFNDSATGVSWIFHLPTPIQEKTYVPFFSKETQVIFLSLFVSFLFTLIISIWFAHRYGSPLMLFVNWLKRMENQQYSEVFTEKEKRKIFKKNGKIRHRFRLYEEVIYSLKDLSSKLEKIETERKQLELTREEWMTGISHDMRTPLSTVQGYGHILESNQFTFTEEELQNIGKDLREKSEYMLEMLNDFSLIFQLKNSAIQMNLNKIDANEFVRDVANKFIKDLTIQHTITFHPNSKPIWIYIDPKWFERVLDNIIYNSIKHNPVDTKIDISLSHNHQFGIIEIKDNGIGMDEESVKKLFNRYYQGTNTTEKKAGTGLGMSIAKGIVDLHHGHIEVQSELAVGTWVSIYVPLVENEEEKIVLEDRVHEKLFTS